MSRSEDLRRSFYERAWYIVTAISYRDFEMAANALLAFYDREGGGELARQMFLLGSGYLNNPLGHSISCSAFIKALCDLYQGNYNPHYLAGLGSTLWIIDRY